MDRVIESILFGLAKMSFCYWLAVISVHKHRIFKMQLSWFEFFGRPLMNKFEMRRWDAAEHLRDEADIVAYLDAALEDGDPALITAVLEDIARAKMMAGSALQTDLGAQNLHDILTADRDPRLSTVLKAMRALGLQFHIQAV
jgi:probable addiction module antidote protein